MDRTAIFFLLLSLFLRVSNCAVIGLAHSVANTEEHYEIFRDGFLLDDEEILEGKSTHKTNVETTEPEGPEDIVPMVDLEADTDDLKKIEDYVIPKHRIKKIISKHGRSKRYVFDYDGFKWPDGIIPYQIHHSYTKEEVNLIYRAMALWENHTCIRFVERTNQKDYIVIIPGNGCYSYVGRYGRGAQSVSLARNCFDLGTPVHELGHAIGLFHEHSRYDRDNYVKVNYDNIDSGSDPSQFNILDYDGMSTLGLPYDYNSIMHYSGDQSAKDASKHTIEAHDSNIIVGRAIKPSTIDIMKVNIYYKCKAPFPPRTTFWTPLPPEEEEIPPRPHECGGLIKGQLSGGFSTPNFPQYTNNLCCSWQIIAPEGYRLKMDITSFGLTDSYTASCADGNITFLQLDATKRFFSRICRYDAYHDRPYYTRYNEAHIMHCSGEPSSNNPKIGFSMRFTALDINECESGSKCSHKCINTPGGYACACNKGYYLSADAHTCFDVNECTVNNSLCEYKCRNYGGHYKCICPDESYQTGRSCNPDKSDFKTTKLSQTTMPLPTTTMPPTTMKPTTMKPTTMEPTTMKPTTMKPTTMKPTTMKPTTMEPTTMKPTTMKPTTMKPTTVAPTTMKPTTLPPSTSVPTTKPSTSPPPSTESPTVVTVATSTVRTTELTAMQGEFTTPNWPETYPVNHDLEWVIHCPTDHTVEIDLSKEPFGIAGNMPDCNKDWVEVYDGNSQDSKVLGKFCHYSLPPVMSTTSNIATVKFHSGPKHSPSRRGFSASYKCIAKCPPLQLPSLPRCGGYINANSGVISSPNWPSTYNINEYCEWIIELPDCQKVIEINFTNFSVAGKMPACTKDTLHVDDGIEDGDKTYGPFCHLSLPPKIRTTSNVVRFRFNAGPQHGTTRFGFSARFQAVDK